MSESAALLQNLGEIARIVHEGHNPQDVLERMAYAICFNSPWQSSSIMAVDYEAQQSVQVAHFRRFMSDRTRPKSWHLSISPTADVIASGKPVIISDALTDQRYMGYWSEAQLDRFRTVVLLPLRVADAAGRPMVISLQALDTFEVTETMLKYLSTVADLAGMALDKGQRLMAEREVGVKLETVLELQRSVVTQAFRESSVDALLPLCRKHLTHPFIIVDLVSGRADCGGFPNDTAMRTALNGLGWRQIEKLFRDRTPARFDARGSIEVQVDGDCATLNLVAEPIMAGGQTIGGIAIISQDALEDDIIRTAEAIWMALSVMLLRHHIGREAGARTMSQALTDLLEGRLERLQRSEIGELPFIDQPHRILAVRAGPGQAPSSTVEWSLGRLADNAQSRIPHGIVGGFVVFVVPEALGDGLRTFADRLLSEAKRVAGSEVVLIESHVCADISDYSAAWRQVVRLSAWAVERGRYGKISTADSGSFGLLAGILDYRVVEDFCGSVLKQIHEHDRSSSTPLFPTVVSLVRHGGRLQPAAAETGMHITTIRYRVERIKELFGLDLRDSDARFTLDMAIRLDALVNVDAGVRN